MAEARRQRMPKIRVGTLGGRRSGIYFLTPDFDVPAGGIRVMYRHVDLLNQAGTPAAVLHSRPGFRCSWFDSSGTRVANLAETELTADDVLVVPEIYAGVLPTLSEVRHVLFDQSGHLLMSRPSEGIVEHIGTSGAFAGVLAVSEHSQRMLSYIFPSANIARVHLSLDPDVFWCGDSPRRGIVHLTRRGGSEAARALAMLQARGSLSDVPVESVGGRSQQDLADVLRRTSIFLHLPYQEGFGLPALEAMACGAYVVGYHGYGGQEFFGREFSASVETGDLLGLAQAIERALDNEARQPGWLASRGRDAAASVARNYAPAREAAEVVQYYSRVFG